MTPDQYTSRQECTVSSTHDKSSKDIRSTSPVLRPYAAEHNVSFQSLPTTVLGRDDLPSPTRYCQTSSSSSPNWSPTTPTSSPLGNRLPFSHLVSPSVSPTDGRCQFQPSIRSQPLDGPSNSYAPYTPTPRFRSPTGSEIQFPSQAPRKNKPRPSTAPQPLSSSNPFTTGDSGVLGVRSRGRRISPWFSVGIKSLLSKPARPSLPRHSVCSTPSGSPAQPLVQHIIPKSRPPDLDVAACPSGSPPHSGTSSDIHFRNVIDGAKVPGLVPLFSSSSMQESCESPNHKSFAVVRRENGKPNVLRRRPTGIVKSPRDKGDKVTALTDHNQRDSPFGASLPPSPFFLKSGQKDHVSNKPLDLPIIETSVQQEFFCDDNDTQKVSVDARHDLRDHIYESNTMANANGPYHYIPQSSSIPYYTVFGASPEWRVTADGPDDHYTDLEGHMHAEECPAVNQVESGSRRLTRKVSTRWKKMIGTSRASEPGSCSPSPRIGHSKGRPSLQEWSRGWAKERSRCTGKSMDGMVELTRRDEAWPAPTAGREQSQPNGEKTQSNADEVGEGGKLLRLMKRLSTGSLRERFHAERDKVVPPVPAIPKEHRQPVSHTSHPTQFQMAMIHSTRSVPGPLSHKRSSSLERYCNHFPSHSQSTPLNSSVARSSVTTTSPSPNSDVASVQFYQRPQSARSSISSYGEAEVPPVPALHRHIISPSEQLRLADDESNLTELTSSPSCHRSTFSSPTQIPDDAEVDGPSQRTSSRGSNTSTSVSIASQILLADGGVALSPPPRNLRGKLSSANGSGCSVPSALFTKADEGDFQISKHAQVSTAWRSSVERPKIRSRFTFRELAAPRPPPLTEQQKADIWDDLLARSEQAGGTLHLDSGGLMSDSLRFSTLSDDT